MAGNEIIIKGRTQAGEDIEYSFKNINPAIGTDVARAAAIRWNDLSTNSLQKIIYRQDVDITSGGE